MQSTPRENKNTKHIFISHTTADDEFVKTLRLSLEGQGLKVWVDSRNMRGGAKLEKEIAQAIEGARQVIVVLSLQTVNSAWVRKEVQKAQEVEGQRKDEGYRVIPLLLEGMKTTALGNWFDTDPLAVPIELKLGGLSEALPAILAALRERLPNDPDPSKAVPSQPVEELILELEDPKIATQGGKRRATGTARVVYQPADNTVPRVESRRFHFAAPLGPIEADELRWYLESYHRWPTGVFAERAKRVEVRLPEWGQQLFKAALKGESADNPLHAWQQAGKQTERCFSVFVNSEAKERTTEQRKAALREAASALLSLPWELLHDGESHIFFGSSPARVRRRLPNFNAMDSVATQPPLRMLLVTARPEDESASYIDHRVIAAPVVEAVENLGELVELKILDEPTFPALLNALREAAEKGEAFHIVHFDGHGVYDPERGLGGLCFEAPSDQGKLQGRAMEFIGANRLAEAMRNYRIPLVLLNACESAKAEEDLS
jgi:hypothetical protein